MKPRSALRSQGIRVEKPHSPSSDVSQLEVIPETLVRHPLEVRAKPIASCSSGDSCWVADQAVMFFA